MYFGFKILLDCSPEEAFITNPSSVQENEIMLGTLPALGFQMKLKILEGLLSLKQENPLLKIPFFVLRFLLSLWKKY